MKLAVTPINSVNFGAGKLKITIQNVSENDLRYCDEFKFVAELDNADLSIIFKQKLESFHLPNHVHYKVTATREYEGKTFENSVTVSLPKNTPMSVTREEIKKAVYSALSFLKEKIYYSRIS